MQNNCYFSKRYSLINKLLQKHNVNTIEDLLEIHSNISNDLEQFYSMDKNIESLRNQCNMTFKASKTAQIVSKNRIQFYHIFKMNYKAYSPI